MSIHLYVQAIGPLRKLSPHTRLSEMMRKILGFVSDCAGLAKASHRKQVYPKFKTIRVVTSIARSGWKSAMSLPFMPFNDLPGIKTRCPHVLLCPNRPCFGQPLSSGQPNWARKKVFRVRVAR